MSEAVCHCGESGYYHCSELRQRVSAATELISLILQGDHLRAHSFENDDGPCIYDMCKAFLRNEE